MLAQMEELNRRVWGDKVSLATSAHTLGGLGIGLLLYPALAGQARPIGIALIALSALAHVYAFMTARPASRIGEIWQRLTA